MQAVRFFGVLIVSFFLVNVGKCQGDNQFASKTIVLDTLIVNPIISDSSGLISTIYPDDDLFVDILARGKSVFKIQDQNYPLVIRGMVGARVRVERNGQLMTGFDQTGYLADDLNTQNINAVKLLQGAKGVLYGSGSIGGVLIVEEGNVDFEKKKSIYSSYSNNSNLRIIGFKLSETRGKSGFNIASQFKQADDFHYADGVVSEHSAFHSSNLSFGYGFKTSNFHLEWRNSWHSGKWERPRGFQNNPFELRDLRNRYRFNSDLNLKFLLSNHIVLENRLWYNAYHIEQSRQSFAIDFMTVNFEQVRSYEQDSYGIRSFVNGFWSDWNFQAGMDFYRLNFEEVRNENDFLLGLAPTSTNYATRLDRAGGIFGLIEKNRKRHRILFTARGDLASLGSEIERNLFSKITAGTQYQHTFSSALHSSFSISRHFRYPQATESTGVFSRGRGVFFGNPDIDPETSYNFEWAVSGQHKSFGLTTNLWTSFILNRITEFQLNPGEFTYENLSKSRISGIDYQLFYQIVNSSTDKLNVGLTGSFIRGVEVVNFLGTGSNLAGIPPNSTKLFLSYERPLNENNTLTFSTNAQKVGRFNRLPDDAVMGIWGANEAGSYLLLGLGVQFVHRRPSSTYKIGTRALNLTDQAYFPLGTHIMGKGRDLRVFFRMDF